MIDTDVLTTLPDREMRAGYAEVVKYGLLGDAAFFDWLEDHGHQVLSRAPDALAHAIATSCRAKAAVVAADEREAGQRALLNLGHTFGHALEAVAGYDGTLLHGEAIAIGMVMAFDYSARLGLAPEPDARRVRAHFARSGLPVDVGQVAWRRAPDGAGLLALMGQDKKVVRGALTLILARGSGQAFATKDIDVPDLGAFLSAACSGSEQNRHTD